MRLASRRHLAVSIMAALLGGCSSSSEPTTGGLVVAITGLPVGTTPSVRITGPAGYNRTLLGSETINGLAEGTYTVSATPVQDAVTRYTPAQPFQSVPVIAGQLANANVRYDPTTANLAVVVTGLPTGASASVRVTGPGGFLQDLAGSATIASLPPGTYTIAASAVTIGSGNWVPTIPSQQVNLAAGDSPTVTVTYRQPGTGAFNLTIDGLHLTQAVQTFLGDVPLVAGRDALLRVFVRATEANAAAPQVRVRLFENGTLRQTFTIEATAPSTPTMIEEGLLGSTWNVTVPAASVRPNLSVLAEVDPGNTVPEADESDNVFPASGTPLPLDVRTPAPLELVLVPVRQGSVTGNVSDANRDRFVDVARRVWPLASVDVRVRTPFTSSAPAVQPDDANHSWTQILEEIRALQLAEGSTRQYYGVVHTDYNSGVAGIAYVPGRAAIGWDFLPSGAAVLAHEIGHSWGRNHAPCGSPSNPDANFPYAGGTIGVYGYDPANGTLKPPTATDIMGYCGNQWVSDYNYRGVFNYRGTAGAVGLPWGAAQRVLLVWGRITDRGMELRPAFEITAVPRLPSRGGPYRLEGRDEDGRPLFDIPFDADSVADLPRAERHFAFTIPIGADEAARLATLRVSGEGREALRRARAPAARTPLTPLRGRAARVGAEVRVEWDPAEHPMALVRDARTGQILGFARGGRADVGTDAGELELILSDGVRSRAARVAVAR